MLTAYLYHRGDRTIKQLDAEGVRQSQPLSSAEMAHDVAHQFPFTRQEEAEREDAEQEDAEREDAEGDDEQDASASSGKAASGATRVQPRVVDAPPSASRRDNGRGRNGDSSDDDESDADGLNGGAYLLNGSAQGSAGDASAAGQTASNGGAAKTGKKGGIKGAFRGTTARCRAGELLWVDVSAPTEEDYQLLIDRFALHPMVIEDLKGREGRPKLHDYGEYLYIIFHALSREREDGDEKTQDDEFLLSRSQTDQPRVVLKIQEIDCLIGSDYAITLHPETVKPFEDLKKRWMANPDLMRAGSSQLLYELMDEVLDEYFPLLDDFDEDVNQLEEQLFDVDSAGQNQKQQHRTSSDIFAFKRALVQVRRIAGPTRDIANVLLRRDAEAGGKHFAYYQDLYDHATRIVDMVDTFRDILSGLHDSYLAMASNRMNEVMKTLTSASIMLLVPGLIAGIYGMNFDHMPELHTQHGYQITLGIMVSIVVVLFAIFKKIDWL